jgi:hypothetical protein
VTTTSISSIKGTSGKSGGSVTSDGNAAVTARGVCWSTSPNPTIADSLTSDSSGTGSFTSSITTLNLNTIYYVRAYATNSVGTGYGSQVSFTTSSTLSFGDTYAGGIVFYLDSTLLHGMVCAPANQGTSYQWGCIGTDVTGASGTGIGSGAPNTLAIQTRGCASGSAASACYNLTLNGYSDWFLPSRGEMIAMATNLASAGIGNFGYADYWTSSQLTGSQNIYVYFVTCPSGSSISVTKNAFDKVRAARAF